MMGLKLAEASSQFGVQTRTEAFRVLSEGGGVVADAVAAVAAVAAAAAAAAAGNSNIGQTHISHLSKKLKIFLAVCPVSFSLGLPSELAAGDCLRPETRHKNAQL